LQEVEADGVAHLGCEALDLGEAEYALGYLKEWLKDQPLSDETAQRIIRTAQRIIDAGKDVVADQS
jgi:hypothetical protein